MTLVDHDQVEVVGRIVAEDPKRIAAVGECLVEREVDLSSRLDLATNLPDGVPEHRAKLSCDWLIDEDVAVSQIQDPRPAIFAPLARPELPDDLQRKECLSGARRQSEQYAAAMLVENRV